MLYIIIIVFLTGIDQFTKYWIHNVSGGVEGYSIPVIGNFFRLTYIENRGGIFGIFQGRISLFTIISAVLIIYIVATELKNFKKYSKSIKIGISIIAAGACGNMIDRIARGYVVDMVDFRGLWKFIFNIADVYIHIGLYIILISLLINRLKNNKEKKNS